MTLTAQPRWYPGASPRQPLGQHSTQQDPTQPCAHKACRRPQVRHSGHQAKLPEAEGERALQLLGRMEIRRYDHVPLLPRIWQLRRIMWPSDAAYVALAEALGSDLVTIGSKLARVPGILCTVRTVRD
jgi:predicted nucleic acid-binding protein